MSRLGGLTSSGGGRSRGNVDVDPVLAAIVGLVIVGGGGLAAYGASQDTDPPPAPAPVAQQADPVVERALAIVQQVDGTAAAGGEGVSSADQRRAERRARAASERGRSTDPFAAIQRATESVSSASNASSAGSTAATGGGAASGSSSTVLTPEELAKRARAQADAAGSAAGGTTAAAKPATSVAGASSKATGRRAAATKPAQVTLRIADRTGRVTRSKRNLGYLVPNAQRAVARVVAVSSSNEVVVLRLSRGAALTGKQSSGTRCVKRRSAGGCELVRVRTGRTAVIRAADTPSGRRGPVTAVRILTVWRGGYKMAD